MTRIIFLCFRSIPHLNWLYCLFVVYCGELIFGEGVVGDTTYGRAGHGAKGEHLVVEVAVGKDIPIQFQIRLIRPHTTNLLPITPSTVPLIGFLLAANPKTGIGRSCNRLHILIIFIMAHTTLCLETLPAVEDSVVGFGVLVHGCDGSFNFCSNAVHDGE